MLVKPVVIFLLLPLFPALLLSCRGSESEPGLAGDLSSPEGTFRTMQAYVRDGEYSRVWSLLSAESRKQWIDGVNGQKMTLLDSGVNRRELERVLGEQYGVEGSDLLEMSPAYLYGRVMLMGAEGMARLRIAEPAKITGDRARLTLTKDMPGGEIYPTFELPFLLVSGKWLVARNPIPDGGSIRLPPR